MNSTQTQFFLVFVLSVLYYNHFRFCFCREKPSYEKSSKQGRCDLNDMEKNTCKIKLNLIFINVDSVLCIFFIFHLYHYQQKQVKKNTILHETTTKKHNALIQTKKYNNIIISLDDPQNFWSKIQPQCSHNSTTFNGFSSRCSSSCWSEQHC